MSADKIPSRASPAVAGVPSGGTRSSTKSEHPAHYPFIDALRGVAFLAVFASHAVLFAPGLSTFVDELAKRGSAGVQLFYVLSAFTLCLSLASRPNDRTTLAKYFLRRAFRIVPMFWVAIAFYLVTVGVGPRWGAPDGLGIGDIALAATLLHGFSVHALNGVVPGGWSVAIEWQFYFLLPVVYRLASTLPRTMILLGTVLVVSFAANPLVEWILRPHFPADQHELVHQFAYFSLANQLPVFVLGLLAYRLLGPDRDRRARIEAHLPRRPRLAAALMVAVALVIFLPLRIKDGSIAIIHSVPGHLGFGVAALLLLFALVTYPGQMLNNRMSRYFGKISYSAYLVHLGVFYELDRWLGPLPGLSPPVHLVVISVCGLAGTAVLASITHALVEEPGMALGRKLSRKLGGGAPREPQFTPAVVTGIVAVPTDTQTFGSL